MATLRAIRARIAAVRKTQQVTKAMHMVAAAKLRRTQARTVQFRAYSETIKEMVKRLFSFDISHPFIAQREPKRVLIVLISSDKGLCGAYNSLLFQKVQKLCDRLIDQDLTISFVVIGEKALEFVRRKGYNLKESFVRFFEPLDENKAEELIHMLIKEFLSQKQDRIYIIYQRFENVLRQIVEEKVFLPVSFPDKEKIETEPLFEPSLKEAVNTFLSLYLKITFFQILYDAYTSEQAARMRAMDMATQNAEEMVNKLTLQFNKARQESITKELMDIIGGSEALR